MAACGRPVGPPPPEGLSRPIGEFGEVLAHELDQPLGTEVRFVGFEQRAADRLTILYFEFRPLVGSPRLAYLAGRCAAVGDLDPSGMSGGIVIGGDPATDPELEYLRGEAQPECPPSGGDARVSAPRPRPAFTRR